MQLTLVQDNAAKKTIEHVAIERLQVSPFNPRRTRPADSVQKLAERMNRNGYEITRAMWVYPVNGHYEVFAGGTRLEAAKMAGLESVPVVVHEGFTEDQITRLADEDNENDEYHSTVPIVDVWMDYKRLADMGWEKQRIATAKSVTNSTVTARLKYAEMPQSVLSVFFKNDFLRESHSAEICGISNFEMAPWLDRETAMIEVLQTGLKRGATANDFKKLVEEYNGLVSYAQECAEQLDAEWRAQFVEALATEKARTKAAVKRVHNQIVNKQLAQAQREAEELARQQSEAEAAKMRLEREAALNAKIEKELSKIVHGDAREQIHNAPFGFKLLLTDPPYGMNFQSNRRVVSAKADRIENDDEGALALLADVLTVAYDRMAEDSTILVWVGWKQECEFRQVIRDAGYTIKGSLIWDKPNHGTGDLTGSFAPKHERIIHAVKGNPKLQFRPDDVLTGNEFVGSDHPTEKPLDLLRLLISATTSEGDCVVDTFGGVGSTVIASRSVHRDFWMCEKDEGWHKTAVDNVFQMIRLEVDSE